MVNGTHRPLYSRERPGTHRMGGWVGPRAGLDGCRKSRPPPGFRSPDHPAHSESLYRLSLRHERITKLTYAALKFQTSLIGFRRVPNTNVWEPLFYNVNNSFVSEVTAFVECLNIQCITDKDDRTYASFEVLTAVCLTLILLMWRIGWAHNNARK